LKNSKKPMDIKLIAEIAFKKELVTPRKKGMNQKRKIRSFVETVKRNIRDRNNKPKLIYTMNNSNVIGLPEWGIFNPSEIKKKHDELHRRIGQISSYFNGLEKYIKMLIFKLIGPDIRIGEIVTSELSFRNLISLLFSLYKYRKSDPNDIAKMNEICKRANNLETKRNQVIHSIWAVNPNTEEKLLRIKVTAKYKHGLKHTFEKTNIIELQKLNDEIVNLIFDISELTKNEL